MGKYDKIEIMLANPENHIIFVSPGYDVLSLIKSTPFDIAKEIYNIININNDCLGENEYQKIINILINIHPYINEILQTSLKEGHIKFYNDNEETVVISELDMSKELVNLYIASACSYYVKKTNKDLIISAEYTKSDEIKDVLYKKLYYNDVESECKRIRDVMNEACQYDYSNEYFGQIVLGFEYAKFLIDIILLENDDNFMRYNTFAYFDYFMSSRGIIDAQISQMSYDFSYEQKLNEQKIQGYNNKAAFEGLNVLQENELKDKFFSFNAINTNINTYFSNKSERNESLGSFIEKNKEVNNNKIYNSYKNDNEFYEMLNNYSYNKLYHADNFTVVLRLEVIEIIKREIAINRCNKCGSYLVKVHYCKSCKNAAVYNYRDSVKKDYFGTEIQNALNRTYSNKSYNNSDNKQQIYDKQIYDDIIAFIHVFKSLTTCSALTIKQIENLEEKILIVIEPDKATGPTEIFNSCLTFFDDNNRIINIYKECIKSAKEKKCLQRAFDTVEKGRLI